MVDKHDLSYAHPVNCGRVYESVLEYISNNILEKSRLRLGILAND